jgi:hypothetical protein
MDPPIQWVGVPEQDQELDPELANTRMRQIDFLTLGPLDRFHYVFGMFIFCTRMTSFYIFRFGMWSIKNVFDLFKQGLQHLFS